MAKQQTAQERIDAAIGGNFGVMAAFLSFRSRFGDKYLLQFLDKVPEQGEALWLRFRAYQKEVTKPGFEPVFDHFIMSIVMPNPLGIFKA